MCSYNTWSKVEEEERGHDIQYGSTPLAVEDRIQSFGEIYNVDRVSYKSFEMLQLKTPIEFGTVS